MKENTLIRDVIFTPITNFSQWENNYVENFLRLQNYSFGDLIENKVESEDIYCLGLTAINLGRITFGQQEMEVGLSTCSAKNKFKVHYGFAKLLLLHQQYSAAEIVYHECIKILEESNLPGNQMLETCIAERNSALEGRIEVENGSMSVETKENNLFEDYTFFEKRMEILGYLFQRLDSVHLGNHKFAQEVLTDWKQYKHKSSVILSSIVTKGDSDLVRSFDAVYSFVLSWPAHLLMKKLMSYSSIENIINANLERFKDPLFPEDLTMKALITREGIFHKEQSFLKYLETYFKAVLLLNVKKFCVVSDTGRGYILAAFQQLAKNCVTLIQFFTSTIKIKLSKKYTEKRRKILLRYKSEIPDLLKHIINIGATSAMYTLLSYKYISSLTLSRLHMFESKISKLELMIDTFNLQRFYFFSLNQLPVHSSIKKMKSLLVYATEIGTFCNLETVQIKIAIDGESSFKMVNIVHSEKLVANYISLLADNAIDDPSNPHLIERIMYSVLLQGGYHAAAIVFLKKLRDFFILQSGLSYISEEDGYDAVYSSMFSDAFDPFRAELDTIIEKIVFAQESIGSCNFSIPASEGCGISGEKSQYLQECAHLLILPHVLINGGNRLIILPDFYNFQKDGEITWAKVRDGLDAGKAKNDFRDMDFTGPMLKGILQPQRESDYACLKKSDVLLDVVLNKAKIPLIAEIMKSPAGRSYIEDYCYIQCPHDVHAERDSATEDNQGECQKVAANARVMGEHMLKEAVLEFRKVVPIKDKNEHNEQMMWRMKLHNRNLYSAEIKFGMN